MKKIVILAGNGAIASSVSGLMDFFNHCNTYWRYSSEQAVGDLFSFVCVSPTGEPIETSTGIKIDAGDCALISDADALIIASAYVYEPNGFKRYIEAMSPLFDEIKDFHQQGKPVGAFCSGSFVLAATGLLSHKQATSAWWLNELFMHQYPEIKLVFDKLVVCDDNLYTAGATTAYLSLCLQLVAKLAGEQLAAQMAKIMLVDPNRVSQVPYMTLEQVRGHKDDKISMVQQWMQEHLTDSFTLDELAERFALTKRTLIRRFKQAVGDTPVNYLQRLRVEQAKRLLETTSVSVEEIVAKVGYGDVSSFRKLFVQLTQLTPRAYRQRFNLSAG